MRCISQQCSYSPSCCVCFSKAAQMLTNHTHTGMKLKQSLIKQTVLHRPQDTRWPSSWWITKVKVNASKRLYSTVRSSNQTPFKKCECFCFFSTNANLQLIYNINDNIYWINTLLSLIRLIDKPEKVVSLIEYLRFCICLHVRLLDVKAYGLWCNSPYKGCC